MKKTVSFLLLSMCISASIFAMKSNKQAAKKEELVVFAAASMTETLNQIKPIFEATYNNVNLVYNFDSSGTLQKQIENAAVCDVFLSASPKQMNALEEKGLIDSSTRCNLLENKTVIAVAKGNEGKIKDFDDLFKKLDSKEIFLAIGNSDVPVGQYTKKIFEYHNIDENKIKSQLTYGSNVKEVTTQVKSKSVDAGIIYATDAASAGLSVVATATEDETQGRVIYPIAVLKSSKNSIRAKDFVDFLKAPTASNIHLFSL